MSRAIPTWDDLPEFPDDDDIGAVVLGPERKKEFHGLATLREIDGMPKIDTFWGGRPKLLVKKFIESDQRITAVSPSDQRGARKWNDRKVTA